MKKNKYIFAISLLTGVLLSGCGTTPPQSSPAPDFPASASGATVSPASEPSVSAPPVSEPTVSETASSAPSETVKALSITIVNLCGTDIGMLSVIDPVTGEQLNIGALENEGTLTLDNWPSEATTFQWAVYNQRGELYQESSTDISSAQTGVSIVLKGNSSIDNVETSFY